MPFAHIDPDRPKPGRKSCRQPPEVDGKGLLMQEKCDCKSMGWRHASSWAEIKDWLDNDLLVVDNDGDSCSGIQPVPANDGPDASNDYGIGNPRDPSPSTRGYTLHARHMLIENLEAIPPVSAEEEDDALASIMEAIKNNRLSN